MAIAFNTALAAVITLFVSHSFWQNLLYSQLIGLAIWLLIDLGRFALYPAGQASARSLSLLVLGGGMLGYFAGTSASDWLLGYPPMHAWAKAPLLVSGFLLMSLSAAAAGTYYFVSREQLANARRAQQQAQAQANDAQLRLLQSQLQPHMLFNTLANLRALIGTHPAQAIAMLDRLNDYLRATLAASRAPTHSLGAEFDRLRDYLELMRVRMGQRLQYRLDLPPELREQPVPTLLLQPLVENAIVHGLDPQLNGGQLQVSAALANGLLQLRVQDSGAGITEAAKASSPSGFGLAQVRQRLQTAYGADATFLIANNSAGTLASIDIAIKTDE